VAPDSLERRYLVIGLGGIGSALLRALVPFLYSLGHPSSVLAVDGDRFEDANRGRMLFRRTGPKAAVLVEELAESFGDRIHLIPVARYLTPQTARLLIGEGDVVFCQPDNHATRRIAERRCARLRDAALFIGGNDGVESGRSGTFGSVLVYLRAAGRDLTSPPSRFHPEIRRPADRPPGAQGCAAQAASAPQLLFTNLSVAAAMLGSFHAWRAGKLAWEEQHLDLHRGRAVPVSRKPTHSASGCDSGAVRENAGSSRQRAAMRAARGNSASGSSPKRRAL
jgi:hypothetical protein